MWSEVKFAHSIGYVQTFINLRAMTEYNRLIELVETFSEPTAAQIQAFAKENPNDWEAMLRYLRLAIDVFDQNTAISRAED